MASPHAAFVGSIPGNYDRYLGPLFFHDYADDLAARVPVTDGMRVLEVACGTGIVTTRLLQRLRGRGTLVATDLNEAMFAQGRQRLPAAEVDWRTADATSLSFPDGRFDAVVCQFGLMFFPDKARSIREAHRVLATGGRYLFNVWDGFERNPVQRITHETVATFFPDDPPQFYAVPCGFHDTGLIRSLLAGAGFAEIECHTVEKIGESPSAADAAIGLIEGNPILASILERRPDALGDIEKAVAARLASELGDHPLRSPLRALVFSAARA